jgi:hypothetical protein
MSSVISCLCEMIALMPVHAPVMKFPRRFLDRGVGLAVGWMYWFACAVAAADQLAAASRTVKSQHDDGKTYLDWKIGEYDDSVIWTSVLLVLVRIPGIESELCLDPLAIVWDKMNWNELGCHIPNVGSIHRGKFKVFTSSQTERLIYGPRVIQEANIPITRPS